MACGNVKCGGCHCEEPAWRTTKQSIYQTATARFAHLAKGRPFALVGVNGDGELPAALKAVRKEEIPWRSFWNGPEGSGGPIATDWNIRGWPTVYVIDSGGIIREKYRWGTDLDAPLEELVNAAEGRRPLPTKG